MVRVYKSHEIDCAVDVYAPPPPEPGDTFMADVDVRQVILLPNLDVCLSRNRARNRQPRWKDSDLRTDYEDFASVPHATDSECVIDNSNLSVDETVEAIDAVLRGMGGRQ